MAVTDHWLNIYERPDGTQYAGIAWTNRALRLRQVRVAGVRLVYRLHVRLHNRPQAVVGAGE